MKDVLVKQCAALHRPSVLLPVSGLKPFAGDAGLAVACCVPGIKSPSACCSSNPPKRIPETTAYLRGCCWQRHMRGVPLVVRDSKDEVTG